MFDLIGGLLQHREVEMKLVKVAACWGTTDVL